MKISKNKVVSVTYRLRLKSDPEAIYQETAADRPLVFLYGAGHMLPAFEEGLLGLGKGASYKMELTAEEGYGNASDKNIIDLDKKIFEVDGVLDEKMITPGNDLTMEDQDGNPVQGKVVEVAEESVRMDFNHPLADENLLFEGEVLDVRDATPEELSHGHVHGPGGHHH